VKIDDHETGNGLPPEATVGWHSISRDSANPPFSHVDDGHRWPSAASKRLLKVGGIWFAVTDELRQRPAYCRWVAACAVSI
jgi:hypothetical protein